MKPLTGYRCALSAIIIRSVMYGVMLFGLIFLILLGIGRLDSISAHGIGKITELFEKLYVVMPEQLKFVLLILLKISRVPVALSIMFIVAIILVLASIAYTVLYFIAMFHQGWKKDNNKTTLSLLFLGIFIPGLGFIAQIYAMIEFKTILTEETIEVLESNRI